MSDKEDTEPEIFLNPLTNRMVKKGTFAYRQMVKNLMLQDRLGDMKQVPSDFPKTAKSEAIYKKSSDVKKVAPKKPKARAEIFVKKAESSSDESSDVSCGSLFDDWESYMGVEPKEEKAPKKEKNVKKETKIVEKSPKVESESESYTYEAVDLEDKDNFSYEYQSDDDEN